VTGTVVSAPNFRQEAQGAGVVSGSASMAAVDFDLSFSSLLFTNQQICSLTCKRTFTTHTHTHTANATRHTPHTLIINTEAALTGSGAVVFDFDNTTNVYCLNRPMLEDFVPLHKLPVDFAGSLAINILVRP
jgi:hypothetical protein